MAESLYKPRKNLIAKATAFEVDIIEIYKVELYLAVILGIIELDGE